MPAPSLDRPLVLDGGLSNALEDRGHDLRGPLWTARLLRDSPAEVAAVHRAYFAAGARVATTASYQAPPEAADLLRLSVRLARDVVDELAQDGVERYVAASVGPYGACLADGSEYRGRYGLSAAALRDFHAPRLEALAAERPDLLAVETIPDLDEAAVLVDLLDELGLPAWVSLTVEGERTRAGQPLDEALAAVAAGHSVVAVGINCCDPADVPAGVRAAARTGLPAVCYPNSGEFENGHSRFDASLAPGWVAAGARLVGGCCRVGPAQIAELADTLAA